MKCEKCSKSILPGSAVILDISLCSRQYQSGCPGPFHRDSITLCPQCAAETAKDLGPLLNSIRALVLGLELPVVAAMKESIKQLRQERDDAQAQLDMYGGDEGITVTLEELEELRKKSSAST